MSEVSAIAISVANPGFEEKLAEALEGLLAPTHKERGVLQYEMYRDMKEPRCFVFIERWEDEETFDAPGEPGRRIGRTVAQWRT